MCPTGYHNGSEESHALGRMMDSCDIVNHMLKCMSCCKAIVVITGRFESLESMKLEHSVCRGSLMTSYIIYTYIGRCAGNNLIQV